MIPASHKLTQESVLDAPKQIEENTDCSSMTSGQTHTSQVTETTESIRDHTGSETIQMVFKSTRILFPGLNYINYTDAKEPCNFDKT